MNREELERVADPKLISDFSLKVAQDFLVVIRRNVDTFLGRTLHKGLGPYFCLRSLASVTHSILRVSIDQGLLRFQDLDSIVALLSKEIKEGITDPSKVKHGERT